MKKAMHKTLVAALLAAGCLAAGAQTVRIGNAGDALSMDPHSFNETVQLSVVSNIYEPLAGRNKDMSLAPLLATKWEQTSPTVWRFTLRQGVKFHDGTPFTADDVVFSFNRTQLEGSNIQTYTNAVKETRKIDDYTVEVETKEPAPILPSMVSQLFIMSKKWTEANNAVNPVDRRKGIENAASFKANGTGPFTLKERQPNVRTTFSRNTGYWGKIDGNVQEVIYTPIANDATRVAALLSGQVDVIDPVPVQDVDRVNNTATTRVVSGPELRAIFLGMDQKRDELQNSSVKGKNPFKDKRVRQAFYQAIDIEGIHKQVMRGSSGNLATLIGKGVNGYADDIKRLPYDPAASKKLLAEAGYPNGFELTMNCSNDRYINDSRICQTVAANLSKVGVKVQLQAETKGTYFPRLMRRETSFYILGWTPTTYDAHNPLLALMACDIGKGAGEFNYGGYCNPKVDALTNQIQVNTDVAKRTAEIHEALKTVADDVGYLPLHQQYMSWGVAKNVDLVQMSDGFMPFKWMTVKK